MKKLLALVFALAIISAGVVLYYSTPGRTSPRTPTPTPISIQAPGWEEVTVHTLCLGVEQSYPKGKGPEPIAEIVQRILVRLGVQVVPQGAHCEAALTINMTAEALGALYTPGGVCYNGAEVEGDVLLTVPGRVALTFHISARHPPPSTTWECARKPADAPFRSVWSKAVVDGLAHLWGPQFLIQAVADDDAFVSGAATDALEEMGPEVVPLLVQALRDADEDMRDAATRVLGAIGPEAKGAIPALIQALEDEDKYVRGGAAFALGQIGPEEGVIPALIGTLGDEDDYVRADAAWALAEIGTEAKEAVPALIQALGGESSWLRSKAEEALKAITGQDFGVDADRWEEWWKEQQ